MAGDTRVSFRDAAGKESAPDELQAHFERILVAAPGQEARSIGPSLDGNVGLPKPGKLPPARRCGRAYPKLECGPAGRNHPRARPGTR